MKKVAANPIVRKIGKETAKSAISVGTDVLNGSNIKNSAQKELNEVKKKVTASLNRLGSDSLKERKRKRKRGQSTHIKPIRKKKKTENSLFN